MLKSLTLTNFRKVRQDTMNFGPGLIVIRGANEASKSTRIEAIGYALFGVKACRDTLAGMVTWGQPEKTLRVEVILESGGTEYSFTRSKAGAEVVWNGGRVTGQTEVSGFAESLLGAGNGNVGKLMLAPQGAIRGALAEGPRATMQLIEKLADFTIIDEVVDLIQSKLLTGPTATAEDRVARAGLAVENLKSQIVRPNTNEATLKVAECDAQVALANRELTDTWDKRHTDAKAALEAAQRQKVRRDVLVQALADAAAAEEKHIQQRDAAGTAALLAPHPKVAADLAVKIRAAERHVELSAAWKQLQALQASYPEAFWEGSRESFAAEVQATDARVAQLRADLHSLQQKAKHLKVPTGGDKCSACGQMLPNAEAIAAHKAEVEKQIAQNAAETADATSQLAAEENTYKASHDIQRSAVAYDNFAIKHEKLVRCEDTAVPPVLQWIGLPPSEPPNLPRIRQEIADVQSKQAAADRAGALVEVLKTTLQGDAKKIADLKTQIAECGAAEKLLESQSDYDKVAAQYNYWVNLRVENTYLKQKLQGEIAQAQAAYAVALKAVEVAEAALKGAVVELNALSFNNALLKRVRAARPIIADRLWNTVLSAVSSYFSQMRGVRSVVTRTDNDFVVDGHGIAGLSGSCLDVLGLSIRLALVRTFLPACPWLILDEPFASFDEERTAASLSFIASAGFKQTLLVTHEEMSESVAAGLITLQ